MEAYLTQWLDAVHTTHWLGWLVREKWITVQADLRQRVRKNGFYTNGYVHTYQQSQSCSLRMSIALASSIPKVHTYVLLQ